MLVLAASGDNDSREVGRISLCELSGIMPLRNQLWGRRKRERAKGCGITVPTANILLKIKAVNPPSQLVETFRVFTLRFILRCFDGGRLTAHTSNRQQHRAAFHSPRRIFGKIGQRYSGMITALLRGMAS